VGAFEFRPLPVDFSVNLPAAGRGEVRRRFNKDAPEAMLTGRLSILKRVNGGVRRPVYFPASFFSAFTMSVFSQG
jgi:hypothetical protein